MSPFKGSEDVARQEGNRERERGRKLKTPAGMIRTLVPWVPEDLEETVELGGWESPLLVGWWESGRFDLDF